MQTPTNEYEDKWLTCKDCQNEFLLEAGEQQFLHNLVKDGKTNDNGEPMTYQEPKRCRDCRQKKKNGIKRASRDWGNA